MAGYKGHRIIYTTHALVRARLRGVSEQEIINTVESPDVAYPSDNYPGREVLKRRFSEACEVSVVVVPPRGRRDPVGVISVWPNTEETKDR